MSKIKPLNPILHVTLASALKSHRHDKTNVIGKSSSVIQKGQSQPCPITERRITYTRITITVLSWRPFKKIILNMDYKLVLIEWLDSKGITTQWEYLDEIEPLKPDRCFSVGFLIEETNEYKTIAQSVSETQIIGRTTIPCCSIQALKEVEEYTISPFSS